MAIMPEGIVSWCLGMWLWKDWRRHAYGLPNEGGSGGDSGGRLGWSLSRQRASARPRYHVNIALGYKAGDVRGGKKDQCHRDLGALGNVDPVGPHMVKASSLFVGGGVGVWQGGQRESDTTTKSSTG